MTKHEIQNCFGDVQNVLLVDEPNFQCPKQENTFLGKSMCHLFLFQKLIFSKLDIRKFQRCMLKFMVLFIC